LHPAKLRIDLYKKVETGGFLSEFDSCFVDYQSVEAWPMAHSLIQIRQSPSVIGRKNYPSSTEFVALHSLIKTNMEYDNDRIIKPPYKLELGYWSWLGMINPLINAITIFSNEWKIWPVLIFVNLIMVPVYFMFAKIVGPELLMRRRYWFCLVLSILSFLIIHLLLFAIYSLVLKFELIILQ